ncbi:MAG: TrkH family potassium uptake protein [Flavobacteriales bacterium]
MTLNEFRERINVVLYNSKDRVISTLRILNLFVSASALVVLASYYGFHHESETAELLVTLVKSTFFFYVIQYVTKILYEFHPIEFIRKTWFEALVMSILVIEGLSDLLTGQLFIGRFIQSFGFDSISGFYTIFIQGYFFTVVVAELVRGGRILPRIRLNPAVIFIISFLGIITAGTVLLMLPEMTTAKGGMNALDALFTSTSASCVTGLMVEDASHFFTFKGHVVLLLLFQLGGLNLITFGSFLVLASRFGLGIRQHDVIEDFVNRDNFNASSGLLGKVIAWCIGIELVGAVAVQLCWGSSLGNFGLGKQIFYSVFHAISAFNNAGITLFKGGLTHGSLIENWAIHWIVTLLVFFGALGMVAIFDLFDPSRLRERMAQPWKRIGFATKVALYFSLGLVFFGAVSFWFLEKDGTLAGMSIFGQLTTSVFQSTTRTSGFNTVNIGAVGIPMQFIFLILMFIGASSSSTGGGIKTSTFAVVLADVWRTIRGLDHVQLFKRTIPDILRSRAYSVLLFFIVGNTLSVFLLTMTESHILEMPDRGVMDLLFEEVSAFGTVGLSTGITPMLSPWGKLILILSMFIGRVGTLTVAFALGGRLKGRHIKYPEGHTMVG